MEHFNNMNNEPNESKSKSVWRGLGIGFLSFLLAVLTVFVINL